MKARLPLKILLLSCKAGEEQTGAVCALAEALSGAGVEYMIADPVGFGGRNKKSMISAAYNNVVSKIPASINFLYGEGSTHSFARFPSIVYYANSLYASNLSCAIEENGFDAVICTHIFAMEAMTAIKKKGLLKAKCYGVLSDYTNSRYLSETMLDGYFVPHGDVKHELVCFGIKEEKIFNTGLPVRECYRQKISKEEARNYLVIPQNKRLYLIMTSGMDDKSVFKLCDSLLEYEKDNFTACAVAGRNSDIREQLEKRYSSTPQIRAVTFTEKNSIYMNACDVIICNGSGVISSEAAVCGVPIVHLAASAFIEGKNAQFFSSHGMSDKAENPTEAALLAERLATNPTEAELMRTFQKKNIKSDAAEEIVRLISEKIK